MSAANQADVMFSGKMIWLAYCLILWGMMSACGIIVSNHDDVSLSEKEPSGAEKDQVLVPWAFEGIEELRPGDILVKPNNTALPGSAFVEGSWDFGHAAIVTKGGMHADIDTLLAQVMIFESHARNVPVAYQLREIQGHIHSDNLSFHNTSFGPKHRGYLYRLRLDVRQGAIDSIIAFVRAQQGDMSSWHAMKRFPDYAEKSGHSGQADRKNWADNSAWYCSLLIWQAVYYVTGADIDFNGGYYVYPNDMIMSPVFDNKHGFQGRTRF